MRMGMRRRAIDAGERPRSGLLPGDFLFDQLQGASSPLFGACHLQEGADGMDGSSLSTDHLAHIGGVHPQLVEGDGISFHWGYGDCVGTVDEALHHEIEERLHGLAWFLGGVGGLPGRFLKEAGHGFRGLGPSGDPEIGPFQVQLDVFSLLSWGVSAQFFDEPAVARTPTIRHYDPIDGSILHADTLQPYSDHKLKSKNDCHAFSSRAELAPALQSRAGSGKRGEKLDKGLDNGKPHFVAALGFAKHRGLP